MRSTALTTLALVTLVAAGSGIASAQPPPPTAAQDEPPAVPAADAAPRGDRTDDAESQQSTLQRELEAAQAALEEAAREIARLSGELAAPVVDEVSRRFGGAGPRAMLGLSIEDASDGVRVVGVSPNGPAAAAGVRTGDVVVALDGARLDATDVSPSRWLVTEMRDVDPGEAVALTVQRADRDLDLIVTPREIETFSFPDFNVRLSDVPGAMRGLRLHSMLTAFDAWRDMELVALTPALGTYFGTEKGLLVVRAPEDDTLGLRDGDVILSISGREPSTPEHAMRILASFEPGETLRMTIMRAQQQQVLELDLPAGD